MEYHPLNVMSNHTMFPLARMPWKTLWYSQGYTQNVCIRSEETSPCNLHLIFGTCILKFSILEYTKLTNWFKSLFFFTLTNADIWKQRERETKRQTDRETDRQAGIHANKEIDWQTERGRETDTQKHTHTHARTRTHTNTYTQTHTYTYTEAKWETGSTFHAIVGGFQNKYKRKIFDSQNWNLKMISKY